MQLEEGSIKEDAQQIKNKVCWKIENSIVSSGGGTFLEGINYEFIKYVTQKLIYFWILY